MLGTAEFRIFGSRWRVAGVVVVVGVSLGYFPVLRGFGGLKGSQSLWCIGVVASLDFATNLLPEPCLIPTTHNQPTQAPSTRLGVPPPAAVPGLAAADASHIVHQGSQSPPPPHLCLSLLLVARASPCLSLCPSTRSPSLNQLLGQGFRHDHDGGALAGIPRRDYHLTWTCIDL